MIDSIKRMEREWYSIDGVQLSIDNAIRDIKQSLEYIETLSGQVDFMSRNLEHITIAKHKMKEAVKELREIK